MRVISPPQLRPCLLLKDTAFLVPTAAAERARHPRFRGKVKEIHDVVAVIGKYAQNGPKSRWTMLSQFKIHNSRRQLPMKLVAP
jgi:hypothetical protein